MQDIDSKTYMKLLKFTLIAPYMPLFLKVDRIVDKIKPPTKSRGPFENFHRNDAKYSEIYVITYHID